AGEIRPVAPVLAVLVLAVALVILRDEAVGVAPDRLENPRPRVADADVARLAGPLRDLVALIVVDNRVNAGNRRAGAAGLHRSQCRDRAAQKAAVLGLPPGVDDDCLALADDIVVPAPDLGLDRLADCRHMLEMVVVLGGLVGAGAAQCADRG